MFEKLPLSAKKALAWSVHLFTATGAVWGFLTLLAIFDQNWRAAIVWMIVAMFVDGFDGMLARWFHVKEYAQQVDGALLDNIIDYLNYVVVAALILIKAPNLLPAGFTMIGAFSILLTSVSKCPRMGGVDFSCLRSLLRVAKFLSKNWANQDCISYAERSACLLKKFLKLHKNFTKP